MSNIGHGTPRLRKSTGKEIALKRQICDLVETAKLRRQVTMHFSIVKIQIFKICQFAEFNGNSAVKRIAPH